MNGLQIRKVDIQDEKEKTEIKEFLERFNLAYEEDIDYTLAVFDGEKLKATCSKAKNVLKCFAISEDLRGEGITATLITALIDKLFEEGIYHSFIFTKPENINIFTSLNYKVLYEAEKVVLLENGMSNINSYLDKLIKNYDINVKTPRSAIVMNCNPFTKGHRYLIEEASKLSEEVIVFILEEDKSIFPFKVRYDLVKKGVEHLKNVKVIPGGEYIISSATFPSYFLRKEDDKLEAYTSIDAGIFSKYFCKKLNITKRFVGEEPYCKVTKAYNEALSRVLKKFSIELIEIPRKLQEEEVISASKVRQFIREDNIEKAKELVPQVTFEFLNTPEGKEIMEKIKEKNSPH